MTDVAKVTPGNAWAKAQGRFLGHYRRDRDSLPAQRMWMRAWAAKPMPRWWEPYADVRFARRAFRELIGLSEGLEGAVALYREDSPPGAKAVVVVPTSQEEQLDLEDLVAVTVYGTVRPSGHFVIDAGGHGELTPSSNPRRPRKGTPPA